MAQPLFLLLVVAFSIVSRVAYAGIFAPVGGIFLDMGRSLVEDLGYPVTFVSFAWALLAIKLRLGGLIMAVTCLICGIGLIFSEEILSMFWRHH